MYKNMYDTFDNKSVPYSYPFSFQENKKDYMVGDVTTYEMDYGNTAIVPFQIDCKYQDAYINIVVYNYRHEEIYCESELPDEDGRVYLNITEDISNKIFKRGYYFIQIQAE